MNTYLIVSETIYNINNKIKDLTQNIDNIITFNLLENQMSEVLEEASYFSMFGDKKCIIVKNAFIFGSTKNSDTEKAKEYSDKLLNYLKNENSNTKLIFVCNGKCDSKKKIYKKIFDNGNAFIYSSTTKTEMKNELMQYVESNGYKIDDNSLWHIINSTLGNFDLAVNELNKIMLYYSKPGMIKHKDVLALTSSSIEDNNFKLIDSIISKDIDSSLKYLEDAKILKQEPSVILALLYREFKLMLSAYIYENNGIKYPDILKSLGLQEWQYKKIKNNLKNYKIIEIKNEIRHLAKIDYEYKTGITNRDLILINYILRLCA